MDYEEEWFLTPHGRELLDLLPNDRRGRPPYKNSDAGGWIPTRMRRASYVYSQNGSVHSNWNFEEYAAMVAVTYLSKLLHQGESLSKTYASVDEMKARYRDREIKLRQKIIRLRPKPRKLFVLVRPWVSSRCTPKGAELREERRQHVVGPLRFFGMPRHCARTARLSFRIPGADPAFAFVG